MKIVINDHEYDTNNMNLLNTERSYFGHSMTGYETLLKDPDTGEFFILSRAWHNDYPAKVFKELKKTTPEYAKAILDRINCKF